MEPTIEVNEGKLLGTIKTNINGDQFYGFHGVPFAKPPLGNLRFKVCVTKITIWIETYLAKLIYSWERNY